MESLQMYQAIPEMIPVVILEGATLDKCIKRNDDAADETDDEGLTGKFQDKIGCIKREGYEEGIPIWKTFVFHFWAGPATPMGPDWTLSPEDYNGWMPGRGNHFLGESPICCHLRTDSQVGYSIEDRCTQVQVNAEREHRALILAKNPSMLKGKDFAWEGLLEGVAKQIPKSDDGQEFVLVSTAGKGAGQGGPEPLPEKGVVSMGKMPQLQWWNEVAKGKAMVSCWSTKRRVELTWQLGIGRPWMSPSRMWYWYLLIYQILMVSLRRHVLRCTIHQCVSSSIISSTGRDLTRQDPQPRQSQSQRQNKMGHDAQWPDTPGPSIRISRCQSHLFPE
jgi:DNA mismatch repair protein MSH3